MRRDKSGSCMSGTHLHRVCLVPSRGCCAQSNGTLERRIERESVLEVEHASSDGMLQDLKFKREAKALNGVFAEQMFGERS